MFIKFLNINLATPFSPLFGCLTGCLTKIQRDKSISHWALNGCEDGCEDIDDQGLGQVDDVGALDPSLSIEEEPENNDLSI